MLIWTYSFITDKFSVGNVENLNFYLMYLPVIYNFNTKIKQSGAIRKSETVYFYMEELNDQKIIDYVNAKWLTKATLGAPSCTLSTPSCTLWGTASPYCCRANRLLIFKSSIYFYCLCVVCRVLQILKSTISWFFSKTSRKNIVF